MIKKIAYCLVIIMLTSCEQSGENKAQSKVSELPLGIIELTQYNFPFVWKNLTNIEDQNRNFNIKNISKKGYDSIFYFIIKIQRNIMILWLQKEDKNYLLSPRLMFLFHIALQAHEEDTQV